MASKWYNKGLSSVLGGSVNLISDTIKVMLVTPGYTFVATHNFVSDVVANEVSGSGYTGGFGGAGRKALSSRVVTQDDTNNRGWFDAADLLWSAVTINIGGAIVFKELTNDTLSPIIAFLDPSDLNVTGTDVSCVFNATTGIIYFQG